MPVQPPITPAWRAADRRERLKNVAAVIVISLIALLVVGLGLIVLL